MADKTICFDFDGVISEYHGWKGFDHFGKPIPGMAGLIGDLRQSGYKVILWTTRLHTACMDIWLDMHGFKFDSINSKSHNPPNTSNKPIAALYVDDRGFRFPLNSAAGAGELRDFIVDLRLLETKEGA